MPPFEKFIQNPFKGTLLTFDPGQTTGWALWDARETPKLVECGQLSTFPVQDCVKYLNGWLNSKGIYYFNNCHVVMEEYRVYSWKTDDHAQSTMHTSRLIGCLEALLTLRDIPYSMCGAGLAKTFATDEKLKGWDMWQPGQKHARDAIRHGVYWLCTPPK